jgi:hypothetical protein
VYDALLVTRLQLGCAARVLPCLCPASRFSCTGVWPGAGCANIVCRVWGSLLGLWCGGKRRGVAADLLSLQERTLLLKGVPGVWGLTPNRFLYTLLHKFCCTVEPPLLPNECA